MLGYPCKEAEYFDFLINFQDLLYKRETFLKNLFFSYDYEKR
jgi:hypothetical protein